MIIIIFFVIAIIGYLIFTAFKSIKQNHWLQFSFLNLIILGASSNLFDRLYYGYVVDFISVYLIYFNLAIFNIADVMILVGVFCLIYYEYKKKKNI